MNIDKSVVTISKKYGDHEITAFVNDNEHGCSMRLDDFIEKMIRAIDNPALLFTNAQLMKKAMLAKKSIEEEMKLSTVFNPPPR